MALYQSKGKISEMSEVQSGTSQSGYVWQNMTLILELPGFQGTTFKQVFRVSGDAVDDVLQFNVGDKVEVSWSMYAREWNGKMFNNVDLVKINRQETAKVAAPAPKAAPAPLADDLNPAAHTDDLPFD